MNTHPKIAILVLALICGTVFGYAINEISGQKRTGTTGKNNSQNKKESKVDIAVIPVPRDFGNRSHPGILAFRNKADSSSEYNVQAIIERDIFSNYREPVIGDITSIDPPPPPDSAFDIRPYCYLNAILGNETEKEAWIHLRTEGKTLRLKEGDIFEIGKISCRVLNIDDEGISLEAGKNRIPCRIDFGTSLAEARHVAANE